MFVVYDVCLLVEFVSFICIEVISFSLVFISFFVLLRYNWDSYEYYEKAATAAKVKRIKEEKEQHQEDKN